MIHILKYVKEDVGEEVVEAMGMILYNYLLKKAEGFKSYSELDRWNNVSKITQENPMMPCLFNIKNVKWDEVDIYTLKRKDTDGPIISILGNHFIGNIDNVLIPTYNSNQDNMLTDLLGACVLSLLKKDLRSSFGYLRFFQMMFSFFEENVKTIPETDGNKRKFVPKLFKL